MSWRIEVKPEAGKYYWFFEHARQFDAHMRGAVWMDWKWLVDKCAYAAMAYLRLRRGRVLDGAELWDILHSAADRGVLDLDEAQEVALADVIARSESPGGTPTWVVVEVSWRVSREDVLWARRRADLLARLGEPTVAVAAGREASEDALEEARRAGVWVITKEGPGHRPDRAG